MAARFVTKVKTLFPSLITPQISKVTPLNTHFLTFDNPHVFTMILKPFGALESQNLNSP